MAVNPYVNKLLRGDEVVLDLTEDTVTADKLVRGYTAHDASGAPITGTYDIQVPVNSLPDTYQEVEYIQMYGAQFAHVTGFSALANDFIYAKGLSDTDSTEQALCGRPSFGFEIYFAANVPSGLLTWSDPSGSLVNVATPIYDARANMNSIIGKFAGAGFSDCDFYIGSFSPKKYLLKGRLYSLALTRIGDDGVWHDLYRFVPCYRKVDGTIGLYDTAGGVFYVNEGTGSFGKGPDVVS